MTKPNWIKILAISCLIAWFLAISLVNLLNKKTPPKLMTADTRWSKLAAEQAKLESQTSTVTEQNIDSARQLVSNYSQQNQFEKAEALAEKVSNLSGNNSLNDLETLAAVERQKGDYKKSIHFLETIAALDQHDVSRSARDQINLGTMHYLSGLSLENVGQRKSSFLKAEECFTSAEKQLPSGSEKTAQYIALRQNRALNERELRK